MTTVDVAARLAYSVKETAYLLGLNPETVHDLVKAGNIHAVRAKPGNGRSKFLIPRDALLDYLEVGHL